MDIQWYIYPNLIFFGESSNAGQNKNNIIMKDFEIRRNRTIYPGGFKKRSIGLMKKKNPVELVENAVHGILPHTKLGDKMRKYLYIYEGSEHPHTAQKTMELK